MRVLLVEDDQMIGAAVSQALKDAAYAVDWVMDGDAAIEASRNEAYDLALLDLGLPRPDGTEVLREFRKGDRQLPVIIGLALPCHLDLFIITAVKYVLVAMRIDNDGEGGILALMSLLGIKKQHRPVIVAIGLFGAAMICGDGVIPPSISVLSALEGEGGNQGPLLCSLTSYRRPPFAVRICETD